jgi:hypothetical protein
MQHLRAYKLAATDKMTLMYFLVNIHINNQPTLYKVNGVVFLCSKVEFISNALSVFFFIRWRIYYIVKLFKVHTTREVVAVKYFLFFVSRK